MTANAPTYPSRKRFVAQSLTLMASAAAAVSPSPHVCLLGDSIFDNQSYVGGKPDVIAQVRCAMPADWKTSLLAVDGATTEGIGPQLNRLPVDASYLVLSVGGNNALGRANIPSAPAATTGDALTTLSKVMREFDAAYRIAVEACLRPRLPLAICTIYNGNFADAEYQRQVTAALAVFSDVIIQAATRRLLRVLELRQICDERKD